MNERQYESTFRVAALGEYWKYQLEGLRLESERSGPCDLGGIQGKARSRMKRQVRELGKVVGSQVK